MNAFKPAFFRFAGCMLIALLAASPLYAAGPAPFRIGVNLEITGPWANVTKTLVMAMEMEVARLNEMGGINGRPLELIIEDNGFDIAQASSNMIRFSGEPDVLAVVGPFEDNFQATTRAIAEREKITNIIVCPSNPEVRKKKQRWSFNIAHNDLVVTEKLADLCMIRGYKKVMVFQGNWPLARSLAQNFKTAASRRGVAVVISPETHSPADIDMTPQLIKIMPQIKSEKADALYLSTGGPPGPIICKNARKLGMDLPILGTHAFGFGFIIGIGGEALEGVEFPTGKTVVPYQLDEADPVRDTIIGFHERMLARYKIGADQVSGHGYDIVWMIADALKRSGDKPSRESFRSAFESIQNFPGCTGVYTYGPENHDGLTKADMIFVVIRNQRFERVFK